MNWQKAKNQLIIILLILNIMLLGVYVYDNMTKSPYSASEESINEFIKMVEDSGIKLDAELPVVKDSLGTLIVKYQEMDGESINRLFFDSKGTIDKSEGFQKITKGSEEITIINNRRLIYENLEVRDGQQTDSIQLTKNFLVDKGYNIDDMILANRFVENDIEVLEYIKVYQDMLLETSYTRMVVEKGQVKTVDRLWIDVIEESDRKVTVDPSYKALLSLLGREDLEGKEISSIRLCYYFNPEAQGILEDNTKAERGRAIPAWRIAFSDGSVEIVDNY